MKDVVSTVREDERRVEKIFALFPLVMFVHKAGRQIADFALFCEVKSVCRKLRVIVASSGDGFIRNGERGREKEDGGMMKRPSRSGRGLRVIEAVPLLLRPGCDVCVPRSCVYITAAGRGTAAGAMSTGWDKIYCTIALYF